MRVVESGKIKVDNDMEFGEFSNHITREYGDKIVPMRFLNNGSQTIVVVYDEVPPKIEKVTSEVDSNANE